MINTLVKSVFGSRNDRLLKKLKKDVIKINALEAEYEQLDDAQLQAKTSEFRERLQKGESLDSVLVEAFAAVREASKRVLGMRHYDVQLVGGMVLHHGKIAEMCTGEGKTLVATLPLYLNALTGKGAHLVTVNDYLAKRDAEQMGKIYQFLGMTVGTILANMEPVARKAAYACDITYGTNNEFGFDYLRDNMAFSLGEQVQRELNFAVVDEVDSILIDEARTPLIISGPSEDSLEHYSKLNALIPKLVPREGEEGPGDYYLDEKAKQAYLTDEGHQKMEELLYEAGLLNEGESLYSPANVTLMHYVNAVLRAHTLFQKDVDYMVKDGEVLIVDEHTGRAMPGRRWSDGLHQAVEAKEGVKIQNENQTLASITFQNYFRLYDKLSGMTGTADTEAYEFHQTYGLEVVVMPTNKPLIRKDMPDYVFLTMKEKFDAIIADVKDCVERGQPVLVGTASIDTSEYLASLLKKMKIGHAVLNAKQHEREAHIIAQAGRPGAVTIATNMAGRGTDIILGGNWQAEVDELENPSDKQIEQIKQDWQARHDQVIANGGLHIVGTERHESRRVDNQLRGRSGRQGDPGSSRFYLSLEDNLIRIFVPNWMSGMMQKMGMGNGEPIESRNVTKQVAKAQKKVEAHYYDIRKQLLEYDDVANDQRHAIYSQRQELLEGDDVQALVETFKRETMSLLVDQHLPPDSIEEQWDLEGFERSLHEDFALEAPVKQWFDEDDTFDTEALKAKLVQLMDDSLKAKQEVLAAHQSENMEEAGKTLNDFAKTVTLQSLDTHWREHLNNMDHLRNSIGLRGYAQKDPKQEYKRESYFLFEEMLNNFRYDVISTIAKVQIEAPEQVESAQAQWAAHQPEMHFNHPQASGLGQDAAQETGAEGELDKPKQVVRDGPKVGRNDPCPCGSGKKYKQCHGKLS